MTGSIWAAAGAALGLAWATGYGGLVLADFLGTTWILRSCIFTYEWGRRPPADVDTRADAMAEHILREWEARPVDEVVVVGHSSGTFVVIAVMARLVKKSGARGPAPQIKLLTLGQCIPYLSFAASATDFRRDLELVGHSRIPWVDVTAATDVMCFFRVNPLAATSYIPTAEERPKMITARFFEMFSPKAYTKLKRDMVRLHFQYMMASEKRSSFDYFELTAGPRPFEEQAWATPRRKRKSEM
jgi:pimeloyl-ACP methyl ester carboxylesterase